MVEERRGYRGLIGKEGTVLGRRVKEAGIYSGGRVEVLERRVAGIGVPPSECSSNVMTIMSFRWVDGDGTWRHASQRWWPRVAA